MFNTYFAGTTISATPGHCQECHTTAEGGFTCGADKDSCYAGLVASGKITPSNGPASPIGDPNQSMLAWFGNPQNPPGVLAFMPSDEAVRNPRAVAAVCGWVAAGARDDKTDGQTCAGAYECANNGCCSGVCDNPQTDWANCGSCGHACVPGVACASGSCGLTCDATNGLVDNFDDNNNVVALKEARNGIISAYKDALGTTITPAAGTFTAGSPGNGGTGFAGHISGHTANSSSGVFAGLNMDFKSPRATYDASKYLGFTFWAKKGSSGASSALRVDVPDINTDAQGGVCTSCGHYFGANFTLTTTWTKYTALFATMTQESGGSPRPALVDPAHLYGIKFQFATKNANYDIWVDDVNFTCN
jgi:hypothetical protein